jgi:hypothetical protein
MGVATGTAIVSTEFTLPDEFGVGDWSLEVVANGIPSEALAVEVSAGGHQCQALLANLALRRNDGGPKITVADGRALERQLSACYRDGYITDAQYTNALAEIGEINSEPDVPPQPIRSPFQPQFP